MTDNKEFWKTVQPFLSDKVTTFPKISLVKRGETILDECKVANSFRNFFENAIHILDIKPKEHFQESSDLKNLVETSVKKLEQHPRINLINKNISSNGSFHFSLADHENILKEIINLDNNKKGTFKNIPTRRLKDASDVCSLIQAIVFCLTKIFQKILNWRMLQLFLKRKIRFVENYRLVSVLQQFPRYSNDE